jgi:outer membrane protein assembly factor BamB
MSVVWHTRVPSETRLIDSQVTGALGHRGTNVLGAELTAKMEETRKNLPRLRGQAMEEWIKKWVADHLNEEQKLVLGSWVESRFKQGLKAIDLEWLDKVNARTGKPFATQVEMVRWLEDEGFPPDVKERVLGAVPDTIKVGRDTLICLDAESGKTLWKFEHDGKPTGRQTSGTPAVVDGKVYAVGSTHLYAVDAEKGELVWKTELKPAGAGSSPLVHDDKVWVMAGGVMCVSAKDGKTLWTNKDVKGDTASPLLWTTSDGKTTLVCNARQTLVGLDPATGLELWTVPGGGQSSPVVEGDRLVVFSGTKDVGLRCYLAKPDGKPEESWSHWWMSRRYTGSPLIHEGHVYLTCGGKHQCLELVTGKVMWQEEVESTITSPVLIDGKFLTLEGNGMFLRLAKASPQKYELLGRTKVEAMWCPTPAPSHGRLVVRRKDKMVCFDLRGGAAQ